MSLWTDLDAIARWNLVQDLTATGWQLMSSSIDYDSASDQPIFFAPDGTLRYLDGNSAPLPVSINAGGWTDPDAVADDGRGRALIFILVAAAGVAVLIATRK